MPVVLVAAVRMYEVVIDEEPVPGSSARPGAVRCRMWRRQRFSHIDHNKKRCRIINMINTKQRYNNEIRQ